MKRVVIVGAGAAGLIAAGAAAQNGADVVLIERNARPARKVMITGKGRCNVTNDCQIQELIEHVPSNGRFLYSAFSLLGPSDIQRLLSEYGVETKVERGNRVFPVTDKAVDVVDALVAFAKQRGTRIEQGRVRKLLIDNGCCVGVETEDGAVFEADAVLVCTGGLSYPGTGSTGDGYELAKQAGHSLVPTRPSLVPLCIKEYDCTAMQGLSLKNCVLKLIDTATDKVLFEEMGEMMFTHFGVTGPLVLSASAHMRHMANGRYRLLLDLKPALSEKQLDERLIKEITTHKNASVSTMLATLVPRSMIPIVAGRAGLALSLNCNAITKEQRARLLGVLKCFAMTVEDFRPVSEAIVTAGGVSVKEVNAKTMESKLVKGLYFAGEVLDLDAYTGGFNLQIAFSTGYAAGIAIADN